jgi:hypothetical protein
MSNIYLSTVWHKADQALRDIKKFIFCGYSFPDADLHVKYLLKRMQTGGGSNRSTKFIIINNHKGKKGGAISIRAVFRKEEC